MSSKPSKSESSPASVAEPAVAAVGAPPAAYSHVTRLHGARIEHSFETDKAIATLENGETQEFSSNATEHGTVDKPTALMQAIHWSKAVLKARQQADADEVLAKRNRSIAEAKRRAQEAR